LVLADVWRTTPFVALLCYARLLTIPAELYEAAEVDGAAGVQAFARITWPLVRPILLLAVLFRTLDALRAFDIMFVLTGGGPAGTTETLTVYAYRALFQTLRLGGERRRVRAGDGRRVGVSETASHGHGRVVNARVRALADVLVVLALAAYAIPFF